MTWNLDNSHTEVQFSVRHMMISTVRGKFSEVSAEAQIDVENLSNSQITARAKVASIDTGVQKRDDHLRSDDFFNAEKHPELILKTTKISADNGKLTVEADLTIRETTKSITLKGEINGPIKGPWGQNHIGISVAGEINREDFGLGWNQALETGGVVVGKKVKISIDAEFVSA